MENELNKQIDDILDIKSNIYKKNKSQIDELEKLIKLQEQIEEIFIRYNLPLTKTEERFKSLEEHLEYLSSKNSYKIDKIEDVFYLDTYNDVKIIDKIQGDFTLHHGTSVKNAIGILKSGRLKANKDSIDKIEYNKIFFASTKEYANLFGVIGGIHNYKMSDTDLSIIFQCQLNDFYTYISGREYFVWGDLDADVIEKIYLCDKLEVIGEISKEELLQMGGIE